MDFCEVMIDSADSETIVVRFKESVLFKTFTQFEFTLIHCSYAQFQSEFSFQLFFGNFLNKVTSTHTIRIQPEFMK